MVVVGREEEDGTGPLSVCVCLGRHPRGISTPSGKCTYSDRDTAPEYRNTYYKYPQYCKMLSLILASGY